MSYIRFSRESEKKDIWFYPTCVYKRQKIDGKIYLLLIECGLIRRVLTINIPTQCGCKWDYLALYEIIGVSGLHLKMIWKAYFVKLSICLESPDSFSSFREELSW